MDIYKLSFRWIYILYVHPGQTPDLDEEDLKQISVKKLLQMGYCSLTRERLSSQMKEKIYTTMLWYEK